MTFIEACWNGEAYADDIDAWIERWHKSPNEKPLHEFLGMTFEQYGRWVNNPGLLQSIVEEYAPAE